MFYRRIGFDNRSNWYLKMNGLNTVSVSLTVISLITALVLNIVIRGSFYIESLNFIIDYQGNGNGSLTIFYNLISLLVNTIVVCVLFGILYVCYQRKITIIVFLCYFLINTYIMMIMKTSFQEVRPFWYAQDVQQLEWGCPSEFGNPSGHSWLVPLIYEPLITDITGPGFLQLGYLFPLVAIVLVPISRMYLGAHSGNQVLMGLTFGLGMCVLYRYVFQRWLYWLFERLLSKHYKVCTMLWLIPANLLCIAAPLIIFGIDSNSREVPQQYMDMLSSKCNKTYTSLAVQGGQLVTSAIINIVFGAMFGIGCGDDTNYLYLYGYWKFVGDTCCAKTCKFLLKLLVQAVLVMIPVGLLTIMANLLIPNYYGKYVVALIGMWLGAFFLTTFSNCLLVRWGIIEHIPAEVDQQKTLEVQMADGNTNPLPEANMSREESK